MAIDNAQVGILGRSFVWSSLCSAGATAAHHQRGKISGFSGGGFLFWFRDTFWIPRTYKTTVQNTQTVRSCNTNHGKSDLLTKPHHPLR